MVRAEITIHIKVRNLYVSGNDLTETEKAVELAKFCITRAGSLFWLINNLGHAMQAGHENFAYSELGENLMFIGEIGEAMLDEAAEYVYSLEKLGVENGGQTK